MKITVNDSKDPVAEQDSLLVQVDYANQPIPNNRLPKGLYYSFKDKWVDMITLLTPAIKKIITANTTVPTWGSITGTLSNQTDLQSALDNKMSSDLTDSHIFVGDATNKATDVEMTGDVTIDNTGATTLADTAVSAGTYGNSTNVPQIVVDSKGRITSASNVGISISGALGYTPENVANKATSLISPDNTKYPTTQAVQTALDLKTDKSIVKCIVGSFNTNVSLTGVTTEQILGTIAITGNTYASNGNMQMEGLLTKLGTAGSVTFRIRVSTDQVPATISSATLVATFGGTSANLWFPFRRYNIHIDSDTSMICHTPSSSIADDITALTALTSLTVNQTVQQYYHITGQLTNAADIVTLKKFIIYK